MQFLKLQKLSLNLLQILTCIYSLQKGRRSRNSYISNRCSAANNKYLKSHYSKQELKYIIYFPASISTLDQRCFNVVDQSWNNVDLTLKMKQNPMSDFQRYTTSVPGVEAKLKQRYTTSKQRWYNVVSAQRRL